MDRSAFYPLEKFPKLEQLAKNWIIIRNEFLALESNVLDINRVNKSHARVYQEILKHVENGGKYGWIKGWGEEGENSDWIQYGIMLNNRIEPFIKETMPKTSQMLETISGVKVCALNTMKANSLLYCHRHSEFLEEGILQLHIGLDPYIEDNHAYLNVNGQFWHHLPGSAVVFDGSLNHFALNASRTVARTIFYMEFYKKEIMVSN